MTTARRAVIGSGVAGLVAAHVLAKDAHVTLYEADARLGGHADTHVVEVAGRTVRVDTGFIVHNDRTYPTLLRLFAELGVPTQESDMSMSVRCADQGLEYAGAKGARGLFPRASNLVNPQYLRMLTEVRSFHREARAVLATPGDEETLESFAARIGFSAYFTTCFLEPLVAAVWSCDPRMSLQYPARYLFEFLDHHGMLDRLRLAHLAHGRRRVGRVRHPRRRGPRRRPPRHAGALGHRERRRGGRRGRHRRARPLRLRGDRGAPAPGPGDAGRPHGDAARRAGCDVLLAERGPAPHGPVGPARAAGARASWNYWQRKGTAGGVLVTYDMTRLQRLDTGHERLLVTLNGQDCVEPTTVLDTMHYEHPLYTPESVAAQRRLPTINTARIAFAGAYHGWGFHEDGARSGVAAAAHLGVAWDASRTGAVDAVAR